MKNRVLAWAAVCCAFLVLAIVGSPALGQQHAFEDAAVSYWMMDGDFLDVLDDNHGTLMGTADPPVAGFVPGMFGNAIDLDYADGQYIQITGGTEDEFDFGGGDLSISAWFTVENFDTSWQALIAKGEGNSYRIARHGGDNYLTYAGGSGDTAPGPDVTGGGWHHVVAISDATNAWNTQIWIDGVLEATGGRPSIDAGRNERLQIGGNPQGGGRSWNGNIDDVGIWGRALTEAEITAIYNGGTGAELASMVGTMFDDPAVVEHPARVITAAVPQGGAGTWGVREVWNAGDVAGNMDDPNGPVGKLDANQVDDPAGARVVDYQASVLNIQDSGNGHFLNDATYGVVTEGYVAHGSVDHISMVASAKVMIPADGDYSFIVNSDDGFEFSIDGNILHEFNAGKGASDVIETANLTAGVHDIRVLYWEGGGGASIEVSAAVGAHTAYSYEAFNLIGGAAIPAVDNAEPPGTTSGWSVDVLYDDGVDGIGSLDEGITVMEGYWGGTVTPLNMAHEDGVVSINYHDPQNDGGGHGYPKLEFPGHDPGADDNNFVVGATGDLVIETEGDYTFRIYGDDGMRFQIPGTGDTWTVSGADVSAFTDGYRLDGCCHDAFGTVHLTPGTYDMELIWQEGGGGAYVGVWGQFEDEGWFLLGDTTSIDLPAVPAGLELVPEPSIIAMLLGVAMLGLVWYRRRK